MRIVLQRVSSARVDIDGETVGAIDAGVLLLVGFGREKADIDIVRAAERIVNLRIFPDARGRLQHSLREHGGGILAVPQFTLYARTDRGRRPDFTNAMEPDAADGMFGRFVESLERSFARPVQCGRFGADMKVHLVNDGPFTLVLDH